MPQASTFIDDRTGVSLAALVAGDGQWRSPLSREQISPHLLDAIVAVEDSRFYEHHGVDWRSVSKAAWLDARSLHIRRGASTLSMQLQRLRDPRPRTFFNKFEQAVRAEQLEQQRSKSEIVVEYLNCAPFGGNLVGAGAASWRYFSKPCAQLSLAEAALLAGLPQSPNRLRPDRFPADATARRNHVLDRMRDLGMIDAKQHDESCVEPIAVSWHPLPQFREGSTLSADGAMPTLATFAMAHRGIRARSTIDTAIQKQVYAAASDHLEKLESSGIGASAVVVLDTKTSECLAAVSLSHRVDQLDLTRCARSTGSTLKPFIYAAAFDAGICTPDTMLDDSPVAWAGYEPADYDRKYRGNITAADALAESRNIPAMLVLSKVGVEPAMGVMQAVGFKTLSRTPNRYGLSLAIGGADATPMEMAIAYTALARGSPALGASSCVQTLVALSAPDRTAGVCPGAVKTHVAWKTGTSNGHRDAWCAAVTRNRTVVVWLGNTDGKPSPALIGAEAAAPLALRLIASLDPVHAEPWPVVKSQTIAVMQRDRNVGVTSLSLISPTAGQQFILDAGQSANTQRVLLKASLHSNKPGSGLESRTLWWFVDGQPAGVADAGERLWWPPSPGSHEIKVIDGRGQAAAATVCVR